MIAHMFNFGPELEHMCLGKLCFFWFLRFLTVCNVVPYLYISLKDIGMQRIAENNR